MIIFLCARMNSGGLLWVKKTFPSGRKILDVLDSIVLSSLYLPSYQSPQMIYQHQVFFRVAGELLCVNLTTLRLCQHLFSYVDEFIPSFTLPVYGLSVIQTRLKKVQCFQFSSLLITWFCFLFLFSFGGELFHRKPQNHGIYQVGRDPQLSSSPTPGFTQVPPQNQTITFEHIARKVLITLKNFFFFFGHPVRQDK